MSSIFWRPLPVMTLTIRQFMGGRAAWVVFALGFVPAIFAAIYLLGNGTVSRLQFLNDNVLVNMYFPILLPIATMILATAAIGNEIEDRTLPYLTLKPLSRFRIVVEKWLGSIWVAIPAILIGLLVACLVLFRDQASDYQRVIVAALVSSVIGICAYCGIFLLISLLIQRALLAGIIYTFVIENILGRYLKGLRVISIQHYVRSIYERLQDDPEALSKNAAALSTAIIVLVAATAVSLLLATWRLRRMSLD
jgi:ABC-2 type transport system permease protein